MVEQFITAREVADRLGVDIATVRRWVRQGRLPAARLGSRFVRLEWGEVLRALRQAERDLP